MVSVKNKKYIFPVRILNDKYDIFCMNIGFRCSFFLLKYKYKEVEPMYPYMNYGNYPQYQSQNYQPQQPVQYMDRLGQLQNMQQPMMNMQAQQIPRVQMLNCGVVDDFGIITANDVPMDGNGAIFVKRDGSEIQFRNWSANGTITTNVFKPVQTDKPNEISITEENSLERLSSAFDGRFRELFEKIDKLEEALIEVGLNKGVNTDE